MTAIDHDSLQGPTLEIIVGTEGKTAIWNIAKNLLSHHSKFFRAACYQPFKEGLENSISLPDHDPDAFKVFVWWLYYEHLPTDFRRIAGGEGVWLGLKAWVLGDKLLATEFQNCTMHLIWKCYNPDSSDRYNVLPSEIMYCWENTPPGSNLRRFISDLVCRCWSAASCDPPKEEEWKDLFDQLPDLRNDVIFHFRGCNKEVKPVGAYLEGFEYKGTPKKKFTLYTQGRGDRNGRYGP